MAYFTNIAVQNVNKEVVYITDLTWSVMRYLDTLEYPVPSDSVAACVVIAQEIK
jgi:hypothetical protein